MDFTVSGETGLALGMRIKKNDKISWPNTVDVDADIGADAAEKELPATLTL